MSDLLSKEECLKVLQNSTQNKGAKLTDYSLKCLSETIEGFLGEHYTLELHFQSNGKVESRKFFVKLANGTSDVIFEIVKSLNAFEKESLFYNVLLRKYCESGIDVSFGPSIYFCENYKVVLEDLSLRNFQNTEKLGYFDLQHCTGALDAVVKFHASAIIYEERNKVRLQNTFNELKSPLSRDNKVVMNWISGTLEGVKLLIDYLNIEEESKVQFSHSVDNLVELLLAEQEDSMSLKSVLHGDLWTNNFMFQYDSDSNIRDCVLLDYQTISYGPVAKDVLHMLYSTTRKSFRNKNFKLLLDYYYQQLTAKLEQYKCAVPPKESFDMECERLRPIVKLFVSMDRCTLLTYAGVKRDSFSTDGDVRKFLFEKRKDFILEAFLKSQVVREILEEDLLELYQMIVKN